MNENQNIEWKQNWRDEYLKWICGFANANGGTLIIGKTNDGKITKVHNAGKLLKDIPNKVRDILGIMVDTNLHSVKQGDYIEIIVEPYPYPVSYKGQYYYRSGSTKQELKGAALDRFLLKKQGKHWDGVPVPYIKINDLDSDAIDLFKSRALNSKRLSNDILNEVNFKLLKKLHLFEGDYLKRAAILLFHPDPEKFVTGAFIKMGYFQDNANILYHDEVHGSLFSQIDKVLEILHSKYLKAMISYDGIQRIETYPIPESALREVLLNAVLHKDYASSTPVQISIYDDKIMFWNPGVLPDGWTIDNLMQKHSSQPFNPDIANTFFRAGAVEAWGRGIEKIIEACQKAKIPAPKFRYEQSGLWLEFAFKKSSQKSSQKILILIKKNKNITTTQMADTLGISRRAVAKHIDKLKKLKRVGPDKGGYWKING
jgi:ATP-dependent DNA helicase RecG